MIRCDSCDIDLEGQPLFVNGKPFCCVGCSEGGPCTCTYEKDDSRRQRNGHSDPVVSRLLYLESQDSYGFGQDLPHPN